MWLLLVDAAVVSAAVAAASVAAVVFVVAVAFDNDAFGDVTILFSSLFSFSVLILSVNILLLSISGYACRLLTAQMKLLICSESTLDVSKSHVEMTVASILEPNCMCVLQNNDRPANILIKHH